MSAYDEKVKDLLSRMTVEEKVGQLQQCGPSLVGAFEVSFEELLNMMFDGRISQEEFGRLMSTAKQDFHEEDLRAGKMAPTTVSAMWRLPTVCRKLRWRRPDWESPCCLATM